MHLKISSAKMAAICPGGDELNWSTMQLPASYPTWFYKRSLTEPSTIPWRPAKYNYKPIRLTRYGIDISG